MRACQLNIQLSLQPLLWPADLSFWRVFHAGDISIMVLAITCLCTTVRPVKVHPDVIIDVGRHNHQRAPPVTIALVFFYLKTRLSRKQQHLSPSAFSFVQFELSFPTKAILRFKLYVRSICMILILVFCSLAVLSNTVRSFIIFYLLSYHITVVMSVRAEDFLWAACEFAFYTTNRLKAT